MEQPPQTDTNGPNSIDFLEASEDLAFTPGIGAKMLVTEALAWVDVIYGKWDLDVIYFVFNELLCLHFIECHEIEGQAYRFDKNEDI